MRKNTKNQALNRGYEARRRSSTDPPREGPERDPLPQDPVIRQPLPDESDERQRELDEPQAEQAEIDEAEAKRDSGAQRPPRALGVVALLGIHAFGGCHVGRGHDHPPTPCI
ncbi:autotransporter beta-domain protein [Mycolicibacterium novocastrense]|uniref:Autotransporter beta-domain protein n=1 Tax=Mycolicibacterium novocastrense TaxID=59813 RepID=A0ABQ0KQY9_MYCNV|nr:autotransporter beta-domain protein [Mycolicibacterium novocastrense]